MYTTNIGEDTIFLPRHGVNFDTHLTPLVSLQSQQRKYLGLYQYKFIRLCNYLQGPPFANCKATTAVNRHGESLQLDDLSAGKMYKQYRHMFEILLRKYLSGSVYL